MRKIVLIAVLMLTLVGCDSSGNRFVTETSGDGSLIVLDSESGEARRVEGQYFVTIKNKVHETSPLNLGDENLFLHDIKVSLSLKYVDGRLLYKGKLNPVVKAVDNVDGASEEKVQKDKNEEEVEIISAFKLSLSKNKRNEITMKLLDVDYFEVLSVSVGSKDLMGIVDENGECISFSFAGERNMTYEMFARIKDYSLMWNF